MDYTHANFIRKILHIQNDTEVIYIRGNHDAFISKIAPLDFFNIKIRKSYVYESFGKKYLVVHGDEFDNITSKAQWLSKLGAIGFNMLLNLDRSINFIASKIGIKKKSSLAKRAKLSVKNKVASISDSDQKIVSMVRENNCEAIICGHIHKPEIKYIEDVRYMNSGDWIESLTALLEDFEGNWEVFKFNEEREEE